MELQSGDQETGNHECEQQPEDDPVNGAILEVCCTSCKTYTRSPKRRISLTLFQQQRQFGCLFRIHERRSVDLEDEPKNIDIKKLVDFKINAADARTSILGFTEILRSKDHGYANPGEENDDLGIQDQTSQIVPQAPEVALIDHVNGHEVAPASNTDINEAMNIGQRETDSSLDQLTSDQSGRRQQTQTHILPFGHVQRSESTYP